MWTSMWSRYLGPPENGQMEKMAQPDMGSSFPQIYMDWETKVKQHLEDIIWFWVKKMIET